MDVGEAVDAWHSDSSRAILSWRCILHWTCMQRKQPHRQSNKGHATGHTQKSYWRRQAGRLPCSFDYKNNVQRLNCNRHWNCFWWVNDNVDVRFKLVFICVSRYCMSINHSLWRFVLIYVILMLIVDGSVGHFHGTGGVSILVQHSLQQHVCFFEGISNTECCPGRWAQLGSVPRIGICSDSEYRNKNISEQKWRY